VTLATIPRDYSRVTDLKQWFYCPRILYYYQCLPEVRPLTYKMQAGIEEGHNEEEREVRRSLRTYGIRQGEREFDVPVCSSRLKLYGKADMVIYTCEDGVAELIPVDYKLSEEVGPHFKLQLAAYGVALEEERQTPARRGFIYLIQPRKALEVKFDRRLLSQLNKSCFALQAMITSECMPEPAQSVSKCVNCEYRRFCNDVL